MQLAASDVTKLESNLKHMESLFQPVNEECCSLKDQIQAMIYYIQERCKDLSRLVRPFNTKGESRELIKQLADLVTLSELIAEDYNDFTFDIQQFEEQTTLLCTQLQQVTTERDILQETRDSAVAQVKQDYDHRIATLNNTNNNVCDQLNQEIIKYRKKVDEFQNIINNQIKDIKLLGNQNKDVLYKLKFNDDRYKEDLGVMEKRFIEQGATFNKKLKIKQIDCDDQIKLVRDQMQIKFQLQESDNADKCNELLEQIKQLSVEIANQIQLNKSKEQIIQQTTNKLAEAEYNIIKQQQEYQQQIVEHELKITSLQGEISKSAKLNSYFSQQIFEQQQQIDELKQHNSKLLSEVQQQKLEIQMQCDKIINNGKELQEITLYLNNYCQKNNFKGNQANMKTIEFIIQKQQTLQTQFFELSTEYRDYKNDVDFREFEMNRRCDTMSQECAQLRDQIFKQVQEGTKQQRHIENLEQKINIIEKVQQHYQEPEQPSQVKQQNGFILMGDNIDIENRIEINMDMYQESPMTNQSANTTQTEMFSKKASRTKNQTNSSSKKQQQQRTLNQKKTLNKATFQYTSQIISQQLNNVTEHDDNNTHENVNEGIVQTPNQQLDMNFISDQSQILENEQENSYYGGNVDPQDTIILRNRQSMNLQLHAETQTIEMQIKDDREIKLLQTNYSNLASELFEQQIQHKQQITKLQKQIDDYVNQIQIMQFALQGEQPIKQYRQISTLNIGIQVNMVDDSAIQQEYIIQQQNHEQEKQELNKTILILQSEQISLHSELGQVQSTNDQLQYQINDLQQQLQSNQINYECSLNEKQYELQQLQQIQQQLQKQQQVQPQQSQSVNTHANPLSKSKQQDKPQQPTKPTNSMIIDPEQQDQLTKANNIIKYLQIELENYKQNYNIFSREQPSIKQTRNLLEDTKSTFRRTNDFSYSLHQSPKMRRLPFIEEQQQQQPIQFTNRGSSVGRYKYRNHKLYTNPHDNYDIVQNAVKFVKSLKEPKFL